MNLNSSNTVYGYEVGMLLIMKDTYTIKASVDKTDTHTVNEMYSQSPPSQQFQKVIEEPI